jgi:hypothetical protein
VGPAHVPPDFPFRRLSAGLPHALAGLIVTDENDTGVDKEIVAL